MTVRGQNSIKNMVKQTAQNAKPNLGDEEATSATSLAPGVKNSRLQNDLEWGLCALRHAIQVSMEAILASHPARSTE